MTSFQRRALGALGALALLGVSSAALGLPWDIDMSDGQQRKGYSMDMRTLPEGVVAQPAVTTPTTFALNYPRGSAEGEALVNPLTVNDATLARGEKMYSTYCWPCHGNGVQLGPIAGNPPTRYPGVMVLAGPTGILPVRTDGYVYLTIRNGAVIMPAYGWAMSDEEIWSTVAYLRTLDNAAYKAPAPTETP